MAEMINLPICRIYGGGISRSIALNIHIKFTSFTIVDTTCANLATSITKNAALFRIRNKKEWARVKEMLDLWWKLSAGFM